MKLYQCRNAYVIRTGPIPFRVGAGDLLFEPKKGKFYRLQGGQLVEVDKDAVKSDSFDVHEFEQATAAPGEKREAKRTTKSASSPKPKPASKPKG